jgi:light-regulated signal transduction histidine kinase (bacteriophytochrome)
LCTYKNGLVKAHAARIQTQVRVMTLDVARLKRRDDDGAAKMVFNCLASTMVSKESVQDTVHDLRQPMQALRLSLRQMLDPDANNSKDAGQIEIIVGLRRYRAGHRVDVHDTGPGLTGNQFQQALQRNERLDRDRNAADGSGLGLSMVKQIVADNEWRIASSEKRRTGASISVFIVANTTAQSS